MFIKDMVKQHHFSAKELTNTMNQVRIQPQIIESMDKPYEAKNWDVYRNIFLTSQRLQNGLAFWKANQKTLEQIQKRYNVPAEIIVAILGVETLYGERQGEYRVLDALATLAFNYPTRAPFFIKELKEYLLLCREHKVSPTFYKGSYAGAIGQPQFMPSSYRFYAIDYNNKANYFHKHGWQLNEGIAQHANLSKYHAKQISINPRAANYQYQQLIKAGVTPVTAAHNHPNKAALMEFITSEGQEYWLAYPNFFVITRYNHSPQYALVVYLLAQQLKQHWLELNTKKHRAYV
jgi:membrane-bound lytic murein transglycosylase B